jgi:SAM-dependent methyltransferase
MTIRSSEETFASIVPIMRRYGASGDVRDFVDRLNTAFHDEEAHVYDELHDDMWSSLPRVFEILIGSVALSGAHLPHALRVLDVGCGTGLATELFRQKALGSYLKEVCLLDTSPVMLERAKQRARGWDGTSISTVLGTLADLPEGQQFDVVLASSVLHHVPDLPSFFAQLERALPAGGLFFHFQDQNALAEGSDVFFRRKARAAPNVMRSVPVHIKRFIRSYAPNGVARVTEDFIHLCKQALARKDQDGEALYIARTNDRLLAAGVIREPMSADDIWRVTDVHVGDGFGLSISEMETFLPHCRCLASRSYEFFGQRRLSASLGQEEEELLYAADPHGGLLAGVWLRS